MVCKLNLYEAKVIPQSFFSKPWKHLSLILESPNQRVWDFEFTPASYQNAVEFMILGLFKDGSIPTIVDDVLKRNQEQNDDEIQKLETQIQKLRSYATVF